MIPYTPFLPQAAHATSSPSRHHDLYAHMHSHTTKVGEGSVSPATIATKALQVMARLARNAAVKGRAVLEDDVARAGGGGGDGGDDDDGAEPDTQTYHFDPMQASDAYETDVGDGENYEAYADDYEYAAAEKDETSADLGRYRRSADTPDYRPDEGTPGGRRSEQVSEEYWSGNVGRFASLGDAAPAMSDEKQEGARKGKRTEKEAALVAADTLRAMGATSQPYQTKPPSAQLGGVRKVGSETFLDDFTNSFEDDLRRELDDAAEEGRTREAAKKLKKEKAAKKEKAKAKKAKAKAAKAKKSEEKLAADTLETETLEAEKTQASHTEGRGETASASLGKAFSKQKRGSKESTKKHGTRFDDDDDDETTHVRSGVKTVSIDDLFQAIGDGDLGDASGDGTGTGTGDDLFQDGDASGDDDSAGDETRRGSSGGAGISWKNDRGFDDTPSKNGGEFVTKLGGHGGRKHSAKTVSDSDETSLFLKAMSKKGVSRDDSSAAASQIATSFRDKNTKISITSSDGHENHFTIGDLGFDDLPGIDDQAVRMYVEGSAGDETRRGSSGGAGISWKNDRGFDDTPSKNGGEFVTKLGGHGGRKHSAKTVSDSDETSLFLKAMSKKGVSRDDSSAAASQIATSFRDKNTKISITSSDGHENHFTIGDLGFDDLPGIDDQAVRMYVEGGREYFRYGLGRFPNPDTVYCPSLTTRPSLKGSALHTAQVHCSARLRPTVYSYTLRSTPTLADSRLTLSFLRRSELYEKGADWVNERYETTVNATSLWVDEYAESGRSKKRVTVDVFVDVSDPYSLELMLGPIQNLLKMDLGPLQWRFHARVNAGQGLRKRVNCGGEIAGSPARTSCVANAAVQCSQRTFPVDVFVDVSDPYSLELMLGPIQNLLKMDLGPLQWRFHARVNAGQGLRKRVNCGGEIAGSPARTSCVANAAVQCSQRTFQNMTSGLGRFEKRAEEIKQRRAQVERAKAALGMDGNFRKLSKNSFEDEEHKNFGSGFWNLPGTKKQSVESVVSLPEHPVRQVRERLVGRDFSARRRSASNSGVVGTRRRRALAANPDAQPDDGDLSVEVDSVDSDEFVSSEATRTSNDYVPDQDTFVDLFEPDDSVAPEVRIGPFSNPKTVCRLSRVITHTHYERLTLFFYTHSTRTTPARAWTSTSTTYRFRLSWTRVRRPKSRRRTARMTRLPR